MSFAAIRYVQLSSWGLGKMLPKYEDQLYCVHKVMGRSHDDPSVIKWEDVYRLLGFFDLVTGNHDLAYEAPDLTSACKIQEICDTVLTRWSQNPSKNFRRMTNGQLIDIRSSSRAR